MKSIMICQAKASAHREQSRKANGFVALFALKEEIMDMTSRIASRVVDWNSLNDKLPTKSKTVMKVRAALSADLFDKYPTYTFIFDLVDKRKITMREVCQIAEENGISAGVIKLRRRDFRRLNKEWGV